MTKTYTVAAADTANRQTLYACQDPATWHEARGLAGRVDAMRRDSAIAEAVAAGMAYDVIDHDGQTMGGARVGGTAVLVTKL